MPTQVLKPARGFLGMVEAQQMGRNPSVITDEVLPSVDMLPFWMQQRHTIDVITGPNILAPAALTTIGQVEVPGNESWVPLSISVRGIVETANSPFGLELAVQRPPRISEQGDTSQSYHALAQSAAFATSLVDDQRVMLTYTWPQRVVYTSGVQLRGALSYLGATATTMNGTRFSIEYLAFPA